MTFKLVYTNGHEETFFVYKVTLTEQQLTDVQHKKLFPYPTFDVSDQTQMVKTSDSDVGRAVLKYLSQEFNISTNKDLDLLP